MSLQTPSSLPPEKTPPDATASGARAWLQRRTRKAFDVAEEVFWAAIIVAILTTSWLWLQGAPLLVAIGAFSALALTSIVAVVLQFIKRRGAASPTSQLTSQHQTALESIKSQHESEIEALTAEHQKALKALNAQHESETRRWQENENALQNSIKMRENESQQYEWLHNIAKEQAKDISQYVKIERVVMINPHDATPSINFYFHIRNKSNYHVTIEDKIEGAILFEGQPLTYPITILGNQLKECPPLTDGILTIRQPLRREEVERFSEFGDMVGYYLSVSQLQISVRGGEHFSQVKPQHLITKDIVPELPTLNVKELKDRIKELERAKAAIDKEKLETTVQLTSELDTLKTQYKWLHEMAVAQAREIDNYVIVERVLLCDVRLTDPIQIPYVEFWLDIINISVYDITVHKDTIQGRIKFRLNDLLEGKEINNFQETIPPSSRVNINIKQRLNPTEVNLLAPYEKKIEEAAPLFNLSEIGIMVSGGTQFPQVEQKRLKLPQRIGANDPIYKDEFSMVVTDAQVSHSVYTHAGVMFQMLESEHEIIFFIRVFNGLPYKMEIVEEVEGFILLQDKPLPTRPQFTASTDSLNARRSDIRLAQKVDKETAAAVKDALSKGEQLSFSFQLLHVYGMIEGKQYRLKLPDGLICQAGVAYSQAIYAKAKF